MEQPLQLGEGMTGDFYCL